MFFQNHFPAVSGTDNFIGERARGTGGAAAAPSPPDSDKAIIFRAKAKCFGEKPAVRNEKR